MVNLDWFLKKPGKVFKLQDAKLRLLMLGKEDSSSYVTLTLTDKLLWDRSSAVKFLSSKSLFSCIVPLNLLEESLRVESVASWKIDAGKGPDSLLLLKSRVFNL